MNRRGFLGTLLAGFAAAAGVWRPRWKLVKQLGPLEMAEEVFRTLESKPLPLWGDDVELMDLFIEDTDQRVESSWGGRYVEIG